MAINPLLGSVTFMAEYCEDQSEDYNGSELQGIADEIPLETYSRDVFHSAFKFDYAILFHLVSSSFNLFRIVMQFALI